MRTAKYFIYNISFETEKLLKEHFKLTNSIMFENLISAAAEDKGGRFLNDVTSLLKLDLSKCVHNYYTYV